MHCRFMICSGQGPSTHRVCFAYPITGVDQEPIAFRIRDGVAGPVRSVAPKGASASAMASAMALGSPQPSAPSGLVVQRVPMKPEVEGGEVVGAGHRVIHERAGNYRAFIPLARWAPQRRRPCRRRRIFMQLAAKSLPRG